MQNQTCSEPDFLDILTPEDKQGYIQLREGIQTSQQNFSNFTELISLLKSYCLRGDDRDGQRCSAVGICWLNDGSIGINTNHLSALTGLNKNVLNSSFSKSGFVPSVFTSEVAEKIPSLSGNTKDLRMWCVRKLQTQTPKPQLSQSRNMTQAVTMSPNPQMQNVYMETQWSYEDYLESYGPSDSASAQANFWDDPFSIPLGSLQNGLLDGTDLCV